MFGRGSERGLDQQQPSIARMAFGVSTMRYVVSQQWRQMTSVFVE